MNALYQDDRLYDAVVTALANLKPCCFSYRITEDQITIALGETGDIWPTRLFGGSK